jgi:hypothetical protein
MRCCHSAALIDQRVTQSHPCPEVEQVRRRDPRLRQPADHQQLAQVMRVGAIGLGAPLVAAHEARLGRLGQVNLGADRLQLLNDKAPAGRRFQSNLKFAARETAQELPHAFAVRGHHPRAADLAAVAVQPLRGDLRSMLIKSHHDRHLGPPQAPQLITGTPRAPELRRPLHKRQDRNPAHAIFR